MQPSILYTTEYSDLFYTYCYLFLHYWLYQLNESIQHTQVKETHTGGNHNTSAGNKSLNHTSDRPNVVCVYTERWQTSRSLYAMRVWL